MNNNLNDVRSMDKMCDAELLKLATMPEVVREMQRLVLTNRDKRMTDKDPRVQYFILETRKQEPLLSSYGYPQDQTKLIKHITEEEISITAFLYDPLEIPRYDYELLYFNNFSLQGAIKLAAKIQERYDGNLELVKSCGRKYFKGETGKVNETREDQENLAVSVWQGFVTKNLIMLEIYFPGAVDWSKVPKEHQSTFLRVEEVSQDSFLKKIEPIAKKALLQ